jgi:hypothetical protein
MGDNARSATTLFPADRSNYPHGPAVEFNIDLHMRQKTRLPADFCRDRHLAL